PDRHIRLRLDGAHPTRLARAGHGVDLPDGDSARIGFGNAHHLVDQRGFAGAVVPEQPDHLPGRHVQVDLIVRHHFPETFGHATHREHHDPPSTYRPVSTYLSVSTYWRVCAYCEVCQR